MRDSRQIQCYQKCVIRNKFNTKKNKNILYDKNASKLQIIINEFTAFLIWEFVALNGIVTMDDNDLTPDLETPNIFAV